ncbi:MAG: hypothetical protein HOE45_05385 [Gammaproteobacteria bacterium]|jgi:hypothetical protein|nr:hypothetical protein [Gammaproteobacteria bacterium]MBT4146302.1 hypothetical protein [Gammaproteobacteria bacterium]MBT5826093.1 hypothetical protein [Gammaproteobacteria bacterium]
MDIQPIVLNPNQASNYIGINTAGDALKSSRSTGILWGCTAPKFIKAGSKKVLYRVTDLDIFISQFEAYSNNAQVGVNL